MYFLFQEFWSAKKDIKRKSEKRWQSSTSEHLQRLTHPCVFSHKILRTLYSLWSTSHSKDYQTGEDIYDQGKPHDFDGMLGTGLPVSMYTTKTPIDKCRFNVTPLKRIFYIFCKRQISIKLFYLYQRLQCTDFFNIKFVLFLYFTIWILLSASWKENDLSWYISVIRQTVRYWTPVFTRPFSLRLHITITYNLSHLRLWYVDVVTVIS